MASLGHIFTHTPHATHRSCSFCALYLLMGRAFSLLAGDAQARLGACWVEGVVVMDGFSLPIFIYANALGGGVGMLARFVACLGSGQLFQQFLKQFGGVGHTEWALAEHLACANALEQFALGGAVALAELLHHLAHALQG